MFTPRFQPGSLIALTNWASDEIERWIGLVYEAGPSEEDGYGVIWSDGTVNPHAQLPGIVSLLVKESPQKE